MISTGLYERTALLVGPVGVARLRGAHLLLAGLGGVGGFAAEALGRAGVGRLTLIDHDVVSASNLNRQLTATSQTIGQYKVRVLGERLAAIHPEGRLTLLDTFLTPENIPTILDDLRPDWVLDAIDSLNCKVALLVEARARCLPTVSSMGAGGRLDPTRIRVDDIMDTTLCPLAKKMRNRLRRRGCGRGILAVWSSEPPAAPAPAERCERGRARVVNGTISHMPALFGITLAGVALQGVLHSDGAVGD